MESLIQLLKDLYTNYKEVMLILFTGLATLSLEKLLPTICSRFSLLFSLIGKKIGGRLAHKNIRETYLNWLVYKKQDLNLTGVIGTEEKPKLEQIFISLRVVRERDKLSKNENNIDTVEKKSFVKTLSAIFNEYFDLFFFSTSKKTYQSYSQYKENIIIKNKLFKPNFLWKINSIYHREGFDVIIILLIFLGLLYLFPFFIFTNFKFLNLIIPQVAVHIGSFLWSFFTIVSIIFLCLIYYEEESKFQRQTIVLILLLLVIIIVPIIPIFIVITQNNTNSNLQSLSSLKQGIVDGISLSAILLVISIIHSKISKLFNRHESEKIYAKGIGDILSSNNYIAILGKPGSGKSTLSQFLALTFAKEKAGDPKIKRKGCSKDRLGMNKWYLPIFIPLKDISKFLVETDSKKYDNLIIEAFRRNVLPSYIQNVLTDSYIYYMLKNKECLFLLDGLDEVQDGKEFSTIIEEINGLISRFPENKVIVTSRHSGWRGGIGSHFSVFEIEDLNDKEIFRFIDKWYNAIEENRAGFLGNKSEGEKKFWKDEASEKASKLKQALSDTKSIRQIAENPLLLSIVCFVHYNKTLPKERLRLYEDCSNLLLVQWDQEKGLVVDDTKLTSARKEEIIQEIAFSFHTGKIGEAFGRKEANSDEIIPIVERKLKEFEMDPKQAESLFQKLIERSGVIIITDEYAKRYSFSHLTFQEFFSAKYIFVNKLDVFRVVLEETENSTDALNGWWREVVLLYCLLIRDPSKIIETLYNYSENDILQQNLQLAVQCLDESVKVTNQKIKSEIIEQVFLIRIHSNSELRLKSLDPRIVPYLFKFAQSPFFYRHVIADKIIQVKGDEVIFLTSKIFKLLQSANRHDRLIAVESLNLLFFKFDVYQSVDQKILNNLLTDSDLDVKKATAKLILSIYPKPLDDTVSKKIFDIIKQEFIPNNYFSLDFPKDIEKRNEYIYHYYIDEEGHLELIAESCKILKRLIEASSNEILVIFQKDLEKILINLFNIKSYFSVERYYHCFECVLENLILIDSELNESYRSQLLEALSKGDIRQQVFAVKALSKFYTSDVFVIQSILDKLNAPHSKVRTAVLSSLNNLNIKDDKFKDILIYLEHHRKPISNLRRKQKLITQILVGRGEVGLDEGELNLLNKYFENLNQSNTSTIGKRSEFYELSDEIDSFLYKKDLSKKIREYGLLDIYEKSLEEDSLLELLNKPDIYLNEAAFDIFLEKKTTQQQL